MYRNVTLLVGLLLVVCLAGVWAYDVVFYDDFESGDTSGWWAPARVGETGQKTCHDEAGTVIACAGTGQDGDIQPGVAWPEPRFVDNTDGTVTDMLTGLVWLKNANCATGAMTWQTGLDFANSLYDGSVGHNGGDCGLTDTSVAGAWRLPSVNELQSLIDYEYFSPALSNAAGTGQWTEGDVFAGVQSSVYWSSTSFALYSSVAWGVYLAPGLVYSYDKADAYDVWPVRGGL
jgi:hypothetical protein